MNHVINKITSEIQFAIENSMNHATIVIDNISNSELMAVLNEITDNYTSVRTTRYGDKIHIHVYWMFKK